jgi:hypothetical protein
MREHFPAQIGFVLLNKQKERLHGAFDLGGKLDACLDHLCPYLHEAFVLEHSI